MGPLAGMKIVELAGIGPVPFCSTLLSDMGAQVIRVDRTAPSGLGISGKNPAFDVLGRGRQSVSVDLKHPDGIETVLRLVESADALVRVSLPSGDARQEIITGTFPHDASQAPNGTVFVANELGGTVTALRGPDQLEVVKVFTDSVQPAGLAPVGDRMGLLDVRKNDLTIYDAADLSIVGSTPAGAGPTHLVADKHGRMIAADTRGDAVRVFSTEPRQLAEVAQLGGPYGITYDPTRDRLWVSSSGTNEVIGYDMAEPTPREVSRVATVQNPYTVGVDAQTGRLFIAGVTDGVVQIVDPDAP